MHQIYGVRDGRLAHRIFDRHPSGGGNYTIQLTTQYPAISAMVRSTTVVQTSTGFDVILNNSAWAYVDAAFYFTVMNW